MESKLGWRGWAATAAESILRRLRRLVGVGSYRRVDFYYRHAASTPADTAYFDELDRINERFDRWLDPGEVAAPDPARVERRGRKLSFPSPVPCGDPRIDRVVLKIYPPPPGAARVGVLFHHWIFAGTWLPIDWLLRPLTRRYRVAVMVAPHNLSRRARGMRSGEGFINPDPRDLYRSFRQWQGDHRACLELLRRDHGFGRAVVAGYSLGAYGLLLARLLGCERPAVAICSTNHYARGVLEGSSLPHLARRLEDAGFTAPSFRRATRAFHLARWAPRISGRRLTWIHGEHDRLEPPESLREARQAIRPERVVEVPGGHSTVIFNRRVITTEIARRLEQAAAEARSEPDAASGPDALASAS